MSRPRFPINWIQWLSLITALAVMVTVPIILVRLSDIANQNRKAIRDELCFFEDKTLKNPNLTPQERKQTTRIFAEALATIHSKSC